MSQTAHARLLCCAEDIGLVAICMEIGATRRSWVEVV